MDLKRFLRERVRLVVFCLVFLGALSVLVQYQPARQPIGGDLSMWDYMAQSIARGAVPYRDVVNIKTPLGAYLGAVAVWMAKPFGIQDLLAIRYAFILQAAMVVTFTYLVFEAYWHRRLPAVLAASLMLAYDSFGVWNASGSQLKTTTLLFGLWALYMAARQKGFWAGLLGALSFWAWQPGLLFAGAVGLTACQFLTRPLHRRALETAAGAGLMLLLPLAYFAAVGALDDLFNWCFKFNTSANSSITTASGWARLGVVVEKSYPNERQLFWIAPAGLFLHLVDTLLELRQEGLRKWLESSWKLAPTLAFAVYAFFTYFNLQSGPDAILFLPFISIYLAYLAMRLGDGLEITLKDVEKYLPYQLTVSQTLQIVLLVGTAGFFILDSFKYNPQFTLSEQEQECRVVLDALCPGDKVYAHGSLDLLVLGGLENADRYIYFDRGKDIFAARLEGGFDRIVARLEAAKPRFVALAKLDKLEHRQELEQWVATHYEPYTIIHSTNSGIRASTYAYNVYIRREGSSFDRDCADTSFRAEGTAYVTKGHSESRAISADSLQSRIY